MKVIYHLLIFDGYESYQLTKFELHCQKYNIIILYMLLHSSYYLQLLDVSCFRPLKQAYGHQIENLIYIYIYINHIGKLKFLYAFHKAFFASIIGKIYKVAL